MPLTAISPENKYDTVFGTIGPAKQEWGQAIADWIEAWWKGRDLVKYFRVKFEVSNTGYPHFHLGMQFAARNKFRMFIRDLQKYLVTQYKDDKPVGYAREKQFSVRLFAVPVKEVHGTRILRGTALIDKYLDDPTKEKDTGGGNFVVEHEGYNVALDIAEWHKAARNAMPVHPTAPMAYIGREYADRVQATADRITAYVKKYQAAQKRGVKLPEITRMIAQNQPPIDRMAKEYERHLAKDPNWQPA